MSAPNKKTGYVGFVGLPNSGKSTLLNTLLGEKVAIVSAKPQATRRRVQGILTHDKYQIVVVDSPGFLAKAMTPLHEFLMDEAKDVLDTVGVIVVLVPSDLEDEKAFKELVNLVQATKKKYIYCLTKSDIKLTDKARPVIESLLASPQTIIKVSEKDGREQLLKTLFEVLDEHLEATEEFLHDEDLFTTERSRDLMAEYIREGCMEHLGQEVPYNVAVVIDSYKEENIPKIYATIFVNKESHKSIVIGRGGENLKKIGIYARKRFETIIGEKVFLSLHVKTKEDWAKNKNFMNEIGYGKNK